MLEGLGDAVVPPVNMMIRESWMGVACNICGPVAKGKSTELDAKLPFMSEILDDAGGFFVVELLMLRFFDPLIKVAWDCWEIIESWLVDSILILASDNEWSSLLLGSLRVQVHASAWLHSGSMWLLLIFSNIWHVRALNNFDFEINVGVEWDWLAADWGPGEGAAVNVVRWAVKFGFVTLVKLWDREVPAVEDFMGAEAKGLASSIQLNIRVGNFSTILKITLPLNSSPVALLTLWTSSFLGNINTDSGSIVVGIDVFVVITVWSIYIWLFVSL